eukprot:GEMP01100161.1.p1 GENE.GEMP01100161.1~~GEMP01100161.1.p1  ORF type:complete len:236 (+),score=28.22 GEMP01100161.1:52-759(+)
MGVGHSLQLDQMQQIDESTRCMAESMQHIERRTREVEIYVSESIVAQRNMAHAAKDCLDTVEYLTSLIDNKSDAYRAWRSLSKSMNQQKRKFGVAINKMKPSEIGKKVTHELRPLTNPIMLFVFALASSNLFFGFLLCNDDVRHMEFFGGEFGYWVDFMAWIHVSIFLFVIGWHVTKSTRWLEGHAKKPSPQRSRTRHATRDRDNDAYTCTYTCLFGYRCISLHFLTAFPRFLSE